MKVNLNDNDEIFTPFSERDKKIVSIQTKKEMDKILGKYKRMKKRYRQYWAKDTKEKEFVYNPERSYLLKSEKDVKNYKLQAKVP